MKPTLCRDTEKAARLAKSYAQSHGYYIREGSYIGTTDDRLGRWYIGNNGDQFFRPYGAGHRTQREAWFAAAEQARMAASEL